MSRFFKKNELLKQEISEKYPSAGIFSTPFPEFTIARRDVPTDFENIFYEPMVILLLQGRKCVIFGEKEYWYGENQHIISIIDMPASSKIVQASHEKPCIGIALKLNSEIIADFIKGQDNPNFSQALYSPFAICNTDLLLLDAFLRLTFLCDEKGRKQKYFNFLSQRHF